MTLVRAATSEDAHALGLLVRGALESAPSSTVALRDLDEDPLLCGQRLLAEAFARGGRVLVAETRDGLAGLARLVPERLERTRHNAELSLLVHPTVRRLGLGRLLLRVTLEEATAHSGIERVWIRVACHDAATRALLEDAGAFQRERQRSAALLGPRGLVDVDIFALWIGPERRAADPSARRRAPGA